MANANLRIEIGLSWLPRKGHNLFHTPIYDKIYLESKAKEIPSFFTNPVRKVSSNLGKTSLWRHLVSHLKKALKTWAEP